MNEDNIKGTDPETTETENTDSVLNTAPKTQTASPVSDDSTVTNNEGVRAYSANPDTQSGMYGMNASQYRQNIQPQQQYQQHQQTQYGYAPPAAPAPKKKHTGAIIAIIAVTLALFMIFTLGAFALGYYLFRNNDNSPVDSDTITQAPALTDDNGGDETGDADKTPVTDPSVSLAVGNSTTEYSMTEAAAKTVNSIVEIRTEQAATGSFMQQYITEGAGSGIIITSDGYIATNNHVIEGATSIKVILRDGKQYTAVLVGTDEKTDVSVIKIDETGLSPVTFGDSDKLVVAQSVIAIGNPLGELGGSVTNGIISALSRDITVENQAMTLLQTTAAVNPGNSGGGLFNMSGELIGIVNAKSSGEDIEGIGFAIPANTAIPVIEDIIKYGYVKGRVQLGITGVEILDNYTAMQYRVSKLGVYVYSVAENSDAGNAGLKAGDLLVKINGEEVKNFQQVKNLIQASSVGDTMTIVVERNNEEKTFEVKLTEYKPTTAFGN